MSEATILSTGSPHRYIDLMWRLYMKLTIGIPTFNRAHLLPRAIDSVLAQNVPVELIVLDDGSTDSTAAVAESYGNRVRYLRQEKNSGLNAARNRILREAINPWVFYLDDDDQLVAGALSSMSTAVATAVHSGISYPVYFFRASNSYLPCSFLILDAAGLLSGIARGDLVPLIQRDGFIRKGFLYQEFLGGEGMLWLRIAEQCGIPTWNICVTLVGTDAPNRITSTHHQIRNARKYAELQDRYVSEFSDLARRYAPTVEYKRLLGSSIYWLLAGERSEARKRLRRKWPRGYWIYVSGVYALSWLPLRMASAAFHAYRKSGTPLRESSGRDAGAKRNSASPSNNPAGEASTLSVSNSDVLSPSLLK